MRRIKSFFLIDWLDENPFLSGLHLMKKCYKPLIIFYQSLIYFDC